MPKLKHKLQSITADMCNYGQHVWTPEGEIPVTVKEHVASFPWTSANVYVTLVVPTKKISPEWWDWTNVGVMPELSIAVISVQVTFINWVPGGTMYVADCGQPMIIGGVVSALLVTE